MQPRLLLLGLLALAACHDPSTTSTVIADTVATRNDLAAAAQPPANFRHQYATVNGVKVHYVIGGTGVPLVLLHGFGQNWYMWNRLLPELSKHFLVIAPDLPGLGESGRPDSGYTKKALATDIHGLIKQLGYTSIDLAGHDIGLMVAYAYAAQYGSEVKKLALMDALLPGIEPVWSQVRASAWWFGFFGWPAGEQLVAGREGLFLKNFWPVVGHARVIMDSAETNEFVRAYSQPGSIKGSFGWFAAFEQDAVDNKAFMKNKLQMPLLAMGGEFSAASYLAAHSRLVAEHVSEVKISGSGHWMVQENTAEVQKGLLAFFMGE